jgi:hypothetical protein
MSPRSPYFELTEICSGAAELAVGNIVRRVLHLIREESDQENEDALESRQSLDYESPSATAAHGEDRNVHFAEQPPACAGAFRSIGVILQTQFWLGARVPISVPSNLVV